MAGPIDLMTVAIIFVAGLVAIGVTVWMLNRAWGDFPSRAGLPPASGPSPSSYTPMAEDEEDEEDWEATEVEGPAGAPAEGLVPVTHPVMLRAVQQALERPGSPQATYFVRDGDRVYLALYRIADPEQREVARRTFEAFNSGDLSDVSLTDVVRLLGRFGR